MQCSHSDGKEQHFWEIMFGWLGKPDEDDGHDGKTHGDHKQRRKLSHADFNRDVIHTQNKRAQKN